MAKKVTIDKLAEITANGFAGVDKRFDAVDKRFDAVDKRFDAVDKRFDAVDKRLDGVDVRLDRIENLLLRDHLNRIERLEDTVLQLKVKVGMR